MNYSLKPLRIYSYLVILSLPLASGLQAQNDWNTITNNIIHYTNGKVGIGTSSPTDPLHVFEASGGSGTTLRLDAATNMNPNLLFSINGQNAANIRVQESANNQLQFQVGPSLSMAMVINSNTNVGIGTTSPDHLFQIHSSNTPTLAIGKSNTNTNTNGKSKLVFHSGDGTYGNAFAIQFNKNSTDDYLSFIDGGLNEVLTIHNGGDVGIGIAIPEAKLHVEGDALLKGPIWIETNSDPVLTFNNTDDSWQYIQFRANGIRNAWMGISNSNDFTIGKENGGDIALMGSNVGIGTTSPSRKLEVLTIDSWNIPPLRIGSDDGYEPAVDFKSGAGAFSIAVNNGASNAFTIYHNAPSNSMVINNGNIGIGTISPSRRLEVLTTDSWNFPPLRIGSDDGYEPTVDFKSGTAAFSIAVNNGANNAFVIYHNAPSNSMVINNGNVGIGTTAPGTYKLAVEGKIGARSVKVTTANWADYVFASDYPLMSLPKTEAYIQENQHLPNIPSADEVKANGFYLEEMDAKLLAKIEELTLYTIAQEKEIKALKEEKERSRILLESMEARLQKIEAKAK